MSSPWNAPAAPKRNNPADQFALVLEMSFIRNHNLSLMRLYD